MDEKTPLRRRLLAQRAALDAAARAAANAALVAHLTRFLAERACTQVFAFAAHRGEPDLSALAAPVYGLPVVAAARGEMGFYRWRPGDPLVADRYGILEPRPSGECLRADARTAILVPSVALDPAGHRLGYGGGYYDRFFARGDAGAAAVVGVCFAAFVLPALPAEPHDLKVAYLATETGVTPASGG